MYLKSIKNFTVAFLKDKTRKNLALVLKDLFLLTLYHKSVPFFYFSRHLYKKDAKNIKDFIPNKKLYQFSGHFNDPSCIDILDNKLFFDFFYKKSNPIPRLLMYNQNRNFFVDDQIVTTDNEADFIDLIKILLHKSATRSVFIKKTHGSWGGSNTFRIGPEDLNNPEQLGFIFRTVIQSGFLFQETIEQHPDLNHLNNSCINTIRMDTFIDKDGKTEVISAFLRMARQNIHVDNISTGGCFVGIDISTGKLQKFGYTSVTKSDGCVLTEHPVSHIRFEDFTIPHFFEVKKAVLKIASTVPSLRLVGWDIAVSSTGPVIIEGNYRYAIQVNDLTYGGYIRNPVFRKVLNEKNRFCSNSRPDKHSLNIFIQKHVT